MTHNNNATAEYLKSRCSTAESLKLRDALYLLNSVKSIKNVYNLCKHCKQRLFHELGQLGNVSGFLQSVL